MISNLWFSDINLNGIQISAMWYVMCIVQCTLCIVPTLNIGNWNFEFRDEILLGMFANALFRALSRHQSIFIGSCALS